MIQLRISAGRCIYCSSVAHRLGHCDDFEVLWSRDLLLNPQRTGSDEARFRRDHEDYCEKITEYCKKARFNRAEKIHLYFHGNENR